MCFVTNENYVKFKFRCPRKALSERPHSCVACFNACFPRRRQGLRGPRSLTCLISVPSQTLCCRHSRGCSGPSCSGAGKGGEHTLGAALILGILGSHIPALLSSSRFVSWKPEFLGPLSLGDELAGLCGRGIPLQLGDPGLPHTICGIPTPCGMAAYPESHILPAERWCSWLPINQLVLGQSSREVRPAHLLPGGS